jgi:hypothetical protein
VQGKCFYKNSFLLRWEGRSGLLAAAAEDLKSWEGGRRKVACEVMYRQAASLEGQRVNQDWAG